MNSILINLTIIYLIQSCLGESFIQKLDHFNPTDNRTFKQQYFVNVIKLAPSEQKIVFLKVGGEEPIDYYGLFSDHWSTLAQKYNAPQFILEHRYYGDTRPTQNLSTKNLQFFTTQQAVADIAVFITEMNVKHNFPKDVKWILFGGSYAGGLVAWARLKYPHLVKGAISSSGLLDMQMDFTDYFRAAGESLVLRHSQKCQDSVRLGFQQIDKYVAKGKEGADNITQLFNLCTPMSDSLNNTDDIATFHEGIATNFAKLTQYDTIYYPSIEVACSVLVNDTIGEPIVRLAKANELIRQSDKCTNFLYSHRLEEYRDESYGDGDNFRLWVYLMCNEFGFFQTSSDKKHVFGDKFPMEYFYKLCSDVYGSEFTPQHIRESIDHTRIMYGGKDIMATNVVYIHGNVDPWHTVRVGDNDDKSVVSILINGTAHCFDVYNENYTETPELDEARKRIDAEIAKWTS